MGLFRELRVGQGIRCNSPDVMYDLILREIRRGVGKYDVDIEAQRRGVYMQTFPLSSDQGMYRFSDWVSIGLRDRGNHIKEGIVSLHVDGREPYNFTAYDFNGDKPINISKPRSRPIRSDLARERGFEFANNYKFQKIKRVIVGGIQFDKLFKSKS